ncbi:hypothetical protein [Oryza sativa Japonica Group]|uniref:Uncharacterized protein n=1 Tax=Oryza sativa subsp. japonica TaxID=39947 RepID=Q5QLS3_ORYSJ|nr:hypothetical protein [Oryza sativa Japonica Group]BAD81839.1 hypothetical protein [Oryza sativa Japonica Group]
MLRAWFASMLEEGGGFDGADGDDTDWVVGGSLSACRSRWEEIQGVMKEARDMKLKKANRDCNHFGIVQGNRG